MLAIWLFVGGIFITFGSVAFAIANLTFIEGSFQSRHIRHGWAMLGVLLGGLLATAGFYRGAYQVVFAYFTNMGWHWPMMGG